MRIVAGVWAGKDLVSPGKRVRSTAEHVRDKWMAYLAEYLEGARVLDLFAGAGALGLEALSRGAASADFVEDGAVALHALKANVAARKLRAPKAGVPPTAAKKAARIFKRDAIPFVGRLEEGTYDVAFADPPYGSRKLDLVVQRWEEVRFSRILAVEHTREHDLPAGGKKLDFGPIMVSVYGIPTKRRRGRNRGGETAENEGGKTPTTEAGDRPSRRPRKALQGDA
jgi:16S rRNA (guanine966-N2)-methyltransferase